MNVIERPSEMRLVNEHCLERCVSKPELLVEFSFVLGRNVPVDRIKLTIGRSPTNSWRGKSLSVDRNGENVVSNERKILEPSRVTVNQLGGHSVDFVQFYVQKQVEDEQTKQTKRTNRPEIRV